jgi:hypothetical protein
MDLVWPDSDRRISISQHATTPELATNGEIRVEKRSGDRGTRVADTWFSGNALMTRQNLPYFQASEAIRVRSVRDSPPIDAQLNSSSRNPRRSRSRRAAEARFFLWPTFHHEATRDEEAHAVSLRVRTIARQGSQDRLHTRRPGDSVYV